MLDGIVKLAGLMTVLFAVFKLAGIGAIATRSWLLVFSPILIAVGIWLLFVLIIIIWDAYFG